ncbi:MAG TPA: hypothetical protein H9731_04020 [Candidatus Borkfalkia excrementipullorum]|mgnify:CR=1 FL=1|nr:hypothetical protein [Candidatus Borkfalkia excrementipullorum]
MDGFRCGNCGKMCEGKDIYICGECGAFLCEDCCRAANNFCPHCFGRPNKLS